MSNNRKINPSSSTTSSKKRPSPRNSGTNNNNVIDLTAFGFSVTKKPRPSPKRNDAAATATPGGVIDMTAINSSSSSDSSSSSSSGVSIVDIVRPKVAAASSPLAAAAAAASRTTTATAAAAAMKTNSPTTTTTSTTKKNHHHRTTTTTTTTAAASGKSKSKPPSPTSDVEYLGTSPPPATALPAATTTIAITSGKKKPSKLFKTNESSSPPTTTKSSSCLAIVDMGKENGRSSLESSTSTSTTTATTKNNDMGNKSASSPGMESANAKTASSATATKPVAAATAKSATATAGSSSALGRNSASFVTARTSLSSSSSSSSSSSTSRAALLDLTLDSSFSDNSLSNTTKNNDKQPTNQKQHQPPQKTPQKEKPQQQQQQQQRGGGNQSTTTVKLLQSSSTTAIALAGVTAKASSSSSSAAAAAASSAAPVPVTAKAMTTLSDMADTLANEIRHDQCHLRQQQQQQQQQQPQQQQRRAKRDKHPMALTAPTPPLPPIAIFQDDASSLPPPPSVDTDKMAEEDDVVGREKKNEIGKSEAATTTTTRTRLTSKNENEITSSVTTNNQTTTMPKSSDSRRSTSPTMTTTKGGASSIVQRSMGLTEESNGRKDTNTSNSDQITTTATMMMKEEEEVVVVHKATATSITKGEYVKVYFDATDMFGDMNLEWYLGMVTSVKAKPSTTTSSSTTTTPSQSTIFQQPLYNIRVRFIGDDSTKALQYPAPYIEKFVLVSSTSTLPNNNNNNNNDDGFLSELYPDTFHVGDTVDALYQDGKLNGKWYRGRIANVVNDDDVNEWRRMGRVCDVMYYDGDYESNIPMTEKKIRLIQRCDEGGAWLIGKEVSLSRGSADNPTLPSGTISKKSGEQFMISFSNGSKDECVSYEEAAKAVFRNRWIALPSNRKRTWPGSATIVEETVETVRRGRRIKEATAKVKEESGQPKPTAKAESVGSKGRAKSTRSNASVVVTCKEEPSAAPLDETKHTSYRCKAGDDFSDLYISIDCGPAVDVSVLETRKTAKDFPPGLPNMLWCALNSPEAQTGTNFLLDLLCIHDSIPPTTMVQKLMDSMKFGPKADGANIHFKDSQRTELATQYVYCLLAASTRLQRRDSAALFGPSSWDDIEVLFLQSVSETGNSISGRRLAQGLQLAARGAKLLSMMFYTELQGYDLCSTSSDILRDPIALNAMPTVRLIRTYGVRGGLKAAVEHMTKCLVRHSRWILDSGGIQLSSTKSASDECCSLEAMACLESLGSATCFIAWLFCVEEKVTMMQPSVAFVIKDAFLAELERSMGDSPELGKQNRKEFIRKCKTYFLMSFIEDFASPLVMTLGKMIESNEDLALVGLLP